jgi:hypothetical protein
MSAYEVKEYSLNGHTFLFTAADAEKYGAVPVARAVRTVRGKTPEKGGSKPLTKAERKAQAKAEAEAAAAAQAKAEAEAAAAGEANESGAIE